jgi:hypothetical protein
VAEVFRGLFPFQCLYHPVFFSVITQCFHIFFLLSLNLSRIFPLLCILFYMILEMQDILCKTCDEYYSMMSNLQKYST